MSQTSVQGGDTRSYAIGDAAMGAAAPIEMTALPVAVTRAPTTAIKPTFDPA
jgi:hypothetical protein